MYDIRHKQLVFVTQTLHPVLEHHTGYLFAEYEIHYRKPRELFFTHIYEAHVHAMKTGAELVMDPNLKPGIVTALDYVANDEDSSLYGATGAHWVSDTQQAEWRKYQPRRKPVPEPETDVAAWEAEEEAGTGLGAAFPQGEADGDIGDIDYFGD
jgi:hypothetical protein